jgi:hypothetical protein
MANPSRGSVAFQVGERAYTMSFSVNALCELEDHLGMPVAQIASGMEKAENVRMSTVRALIWAGLRDHHPDTQLKDAGALATEAGIPACMEAIGKAFALAFPEVKADENPQKAKASDR